MGKARNAAKHPTRHKAVPPKKNYLALHVHMLGLETALMLSIEYLA